MKLKDLKNDKNLVTIQIGIDEDEERKLENTAYILQRAQLNPQFNQNFSKDNIKKAFGDDYLKVTGLNFILPKVFPFIKENSNLEYLVEPRYENYDTQDDFSIILKAVTKPDIELFDYKENLKYPPFEVSEDIDEKVEVELKEVQQKNVRLEPSEKPYEKGNTISADIVRFRNGEQVSESFNQILSTDQLESHFNLEDFIGKNIDDEITENINGLEIKIKINQIYNPELPELDDDLAMEVSDFDTIDEYKESIKTDLIQKEKDAYLDQIELESLIKLLSQSKLIDSNESLNEYQNQNIYQMLIYDLFNDMRNRPIRSQNFSDFESVFAINLIFEIIDQVLKQEDIDIEEQVNQEYENFINNKEFNIEIPVSIETEIHNLDMELESDQNTLKESLKRVISLQELSKIISENTQFNDIEN